MGKRAIKKNLAVQCIGCNSIFSKKILMLLQKWGLITRGRNLGYKTNREKNNLGILLHVGEPGEPIS
jgi:hypothetical protein